MVQRIHCTRPQDCSTRYCSCCLERPGCFSLSLPSIVAELAKVEAVTTKCPQRDSDPPWPVLRSPSDLIELATVGNGACFLLPKQSSSWGLLESTACSFLAPHCVMRKASCTSELLLSSCFLLLPSPLFACFPSQSLHQSARALIATAASTQPSCSFRAADLGLIWCSRSTQGRLELTAGITLYDQLDI